ncbi:unnamed protein product [Ilex paraguariensis]|uniref:Cupin type-1 domain-containing protein n=1 Tax=Ilex paraguariensis TaxID=185542 RepID=A0ABC8TQ92_9AQUA
MAKPASLFSLFLSFLLLFHGCIARQRGQQQQSECQIQRLTALEPREYVQAEAGVTELWDSRNEQLQCAGVSVIRHTIQPRGLLLPSYTNSPLLVYIVEGRGIHGVILPGCPETFQSSQQSQQERAEREGQSFQDRHQRIRHLRQGDFVAYPAGAAHWVYNDGERDLIAVVLLDTGNNANQLDRDPITLAEAFRVDTETAQKLRGEDDQRGHIVRAERGLSVVQPPLSREEQERGERGNGLDETICSTRLQENLENPSRADIYNPRAGRLSTLNSLTMPVLKFLQLSAGRGVLYKNAIMAPHSNLNAHSVMYVTRGDGRAQIVDHRGQTVFNEELREGQIVVVPQNFVIVKEAGNQGLEWVAFKTNDNAMINTLSGRTSVMRGLPVDVVANAYQIPREEARRVKYNRRETILFESRQRSEKIASA